MVWTVLAVLGVLGLFGVVVYSLCAAAKHGDDEMERMWLAALDQEEHAQIWIALDREEERRRQTLAAVGQ